MRVMSAVAKALGHPLDDLYISYPTIRRARLKNRKEVSIRIKDTFKVSQENESLLIKKKLKLHFFEGRKCCRSLGHKNIAGYYRD